MVPGMTHKDFSSGIQFMAHGQWDQAVQSLCRAIADLPGDAQVHHALGVALGKAGRILDAVGRLERALRIDPADSGIAESLAYYRSMQAGAWNNLAITLQRQGRLAEAVATYLKAVALVPDFSWAHNNLGIAFQELGRLAEAEAHCRAAIAANPDFAEAYNNLGAALQDQRRSAEAEVQFRQAITVMPDYAEAHSNLGNVLRSQGRLAEAESCHRRCLEIEPGSAVALNNLGTVLQDQDRFDEAESCYHQALALRPDYVEAHNNLGGLYSDTGRVDAARDHLERASQLDPTNVVTQYNLAVVKRFTANDPHLAALADFAARRPSAHLEFALGKAYEDLGDRERSFAHILQGNARRRSQIRYHETVALEPFRTVPAEFTAERLAGAAVVEPGADGPIFILGMPRSGSTLVEQILASHPRVSGGGELDLLTRAVVSVFGEEGFPQRLTQLSASDVARVGGLYREMAKGRTRAASPRLTDKMPQNFFFCGLIALVLPEARIIHTRRDPVDTCLSCFSKLFSDAQNHTYDLGELGRYYRAYAGLMAHWRAVLPPGLMLEVEYEDVVDDVEAQARRMLAHCGLDWDPDCLAFHESRRPVRTASAREVRRPIYKTSVGRWRPDPLLLQPLMDALGDLAL